MAREVPEKVLRWLFLNPVSSYMHDKGMMSPVYEYCSKSCIIKKRLRQNSVRYKIKTMKELERWCSLMGEQRVLEYTYSIIEPGDVFLDIGANIGIYSCYVLSKKTDTNTVIAVEPEERNYEALKANLNLNADQSDWIAINSAFADYDGHNSLSISSTEIGAGSHQLSKGGDQNVEVRKAKTLIENDIIPNPDVIKVDVEGQELQCLRGLEERIYDTRVIICEVHNKSKRLRKLEDFAHSVGLSIDVIHERPQEWDDVHIALTKS